MKWKSARWLLFIALFMLFTGFFLQSILNCFGYWNLFFPTNTIEKITLPNYNVIQALPKNTLNFEPSEVVPENLQDVDISFKFKIDKSNKTELILKTAPDHALTMLITPNALPIILVETGKKNEYNALKMTILPVSTGHWHSVRIHFWNQHQLSTWFDNQHKINIQSDKINFKVSQIKIGSSLNTAEPFNGEIKNFKLSYSKINIDLAYRIYIFKNIFCCFGILLFIFFLRFWSEQPILTKNQKVEWFSFALLIGFIAMMTYQFIMSVYFPNLPGHQSTFVYPHSFPFSDWLVTLMYGLNPYNTPIPGAYFPFSYLLVYPFFLMGSLGLPIGIMIFTGFVVIFVAYYFRLEDVAKNNIILTSNLKNIFIISLLSYPFWFTFDLANLEIFIFIFLGFFLYFFQKKKFYPAALMVACAGATKIYPLVFILLFIAERQYRAALFCVFTTIVLTIISLLVFHGGMLFNIHLFTHGINGTQQGIINGINGEYADFSVSLFPFFYKMMQHIDKTIGMIDLYHYYYFGVFFLLILLSLYVVLINQTLWKKVFLLVSAMLLFSPISEHYKLIHLFLPLALFINETTIDPDKKDVSYLIMFIILFIPVNYNYSQDSYPQFFSAISNITEPATLIIGTIAILISGFKNRKLKPQNSID
ncbi:MAG: hypothetical protein A3F13_04965 [Gammaproteobacteria bacterium RIFCSPHIGHO2_12_FULL_40_19]|nr:MAG: hypothetical protein A3F13_04965 [Gammaproteobacteria bacterium RIFCSPHIGHO2_12_FULL_40_19]